MYYIYRITNLINGKTYIGQRKYKDDYTKDKYMGSGKLLKLSQKKNGIQNFKKEIIEFGIKTYEEADQREIYYIQQERNKGKSEYNLTEGGEGFRCHHTEESKNKIRLSLIGNQYAKGKLYGNQNAKGNVLSTETKNKMSNSKKGNSNNGIVYIKCIETGEIHRTLEWGKYGFKNAYLVARGYRKSCKGLHFEYVS